MYLNDIPVIDSHCHFFNLEYKSIKLHKLLSLSLENWDDEVLKETILYKRVIRDMADLFGIDPNENAVLQKRDDFCNNNYDEYINMLFNKGQIRGLLIDIGYKPAEVELESFKNSVPAEVKYVYRTETLVDEFWNKKGNFDELYDIFIYKYIIQLIKVTLFIPKFINQGFCSIDILHFRRNRILKAFQLNFCRFISDIDQETSYLPFIK